MSPDLMRKDGLPGPAANPRSKSPPSQIKLDMCVCVYVYIYIYIYI